MKTREELCKAFAPITEEQLDKLVSIQEAGVRHGKKGWYPDCDYSSDADWVYGVGRQIRELEEELDVDDGVFEVYANAHTETLDKDTEEDHFLS